MNFYKRTLDLIKEQYDSIKMFNPNYGHLKIFNHLVEIQGEYGWNMIIGNYFNYHISQNDEFDYMFENFHKMMRQADVFTNEISEIFIDKDEYENDTEKFDKRGRVIQHNKHTYVLRINIGGHLDMIFHGLIYATDLVYDIMKQLFEEYKNV